MEIKVSDYRQELTERWEQGIRPSTQDKYLRAIREAYVANGKIFEWKPRAKFIDGQTRETFELFIKVASLYGFTEGSLKFAQNLDNLDSFSIEVENLWNIHRPIN